MIEEIFDIVDQHNKVTGQTELKSIVHKKSLPHRCIHIWIYNSKGELLLQKRGQNMSFPGTLDASVGGHILSGEEPLDAALRELNEELGLTATAYELEFIGIKKIDNALGDFIENMFSHTYMLKRESTEGITIQIEELESIAFYDMQTMKSDITDHPEKYCNGKNPIIWFEIIEEVKKRT